MHFFLNILLLFAAHVAKGVFAVYKIVCIELLWNKKLFSRLCSDGEVIELYYTTDNSRVYHKEELKSFEIKTEVWHF